MKTLIILVMSSLFFGNVSNNKENDSIENNKELKIEKTNVIMTDNALNVRIPIIIVKRD